MTLLCHSERSEESEATGTGFPSSVEMTEACDGNDKETPALGTRLQAARHKP